MYSHLVRRERKLTINQLVLINVIRPNYRPNFWLFHNEFKPGFKGSKSQVGIRM